ncbi:ROK family protein [Motiliproteus coralliicola]|uniref:ROK family protein n=1 Tax=Motiliproteus coralliicola TaxID=2283196 RepID=A0A369WD02_9GAMM|nr:ROK family protein [Motiliproteus coralliicola]RDE19910.1 ROK family protein [Motiliproteus coralliicola]
MQIGIDLGGSKIELAALDPQGQRCYSQRVATPAGDYLATVESIIELVEAAEQELGQQGSVGICIPGTLSPDHGRVKNANSTCLIGQPLDLDLQHRLKRPVRLANDADCFALSEAIDGAGKGAQTLFGVILGTGVGGGIVHRQQLLSGPNRIAGEWGHNSLPWPTEEDLPALPCYCGKRGCIETYLSGPGLAAHHQQRYDQLLNAEELVRLAKSGDLQAQDSLGRYYDQLARALAGVINLLDPEVIVLGGGLSNIKRLYSEIPSRWGDYVFSDRVNTQLVAAQHGDASGVRGAAWLWPPQDTSEYS